MKHTTLTLALLSLTTLTNAQEFNTFGWSGSADLGFDRSSGNTDSTNLNVNIKAQRDWAQWALKTQAKARFSESDDVRDAENYYFMLQGDRKLSQKDYVFANADYTIDNFSGYDYQATQTVGYGRELFKNDAMTLNGEFGLGARQSETNTGDETTEFVARPHLDFDWQVNELVTFTQDLKATIGSEFTKSESITALQSKMTENLALKASFTAEHTSDVPAGSKELDTYTSIGVQYTF